MAVLTFGLRKRLFCVLEYVETRLIFNVSRAYE